MLWRLERFGPLALPTLKAKIADASGGKWDSGYVPQMHGGGWDQWQGGPAPRGPIKIEAEWLLLAAVGATATDTQAQYQALQGYGGAAPQRLYRRWVNGALDWCNARLLELPTAFDSADTGLRQGVKLVWESGDLYWSGLPHGAGWLLDTGVLLDTGRALNETTGGYFPALKTGDATIHVVNNGNLYARNVQLVFVVDGGGGSPSGDITSVRITGSGTDMTYFGRWNHRSGVADTVFIDGGARRVGQNDTVTDYGNFIIPVSPPEGGWLSLAPGDNPLRIRWTSSIPGLPPWLAVTVTFVDAWA